MLPTREEAEQFVRESEEIHPGPWGDHCRVAAWCAERIAEHCEGMDAEKAQKQADKQISGMMTLGQMFQLITIDNNTASLQLRYTPGKVVFNGQEMSEEEFMSRAGRFVH